jgi:hypothetical protein
MDKNLVRIDGIVWHVSGRTIAEMEALCPTHRLRLQVYPSGFNEYSSHRLQCAECDSFYTLPRLIIEERKYILNKLDSKLFKQMKVLNLDDEAVPIAESKASSKDGNFFVTAILTESKVGQRLVVYAGEKGRKEKTQVFVEPDIKRLAFDQNDIHPSEVFVKLEATFRDGTQISMKKPTE